MVFFSRLSGRKNRFRVVKAEAWKNCMRGVRTHDVKIAFHAVKVETWYGYFRKIAPYLDIRDNWGSPQLIKYAYFATYKAESSGIVGIMRCARICRPVVLVLVIGGPPENIRSKLHTLSRPVTGVPPVIGVFQIGHLLDRSLLWCFGDWASIKSLPILVCFRLDIC